MTPRDKLREVLRLLGELEPLAPRSVADARDSLAGLALICHAITPVVRCDDEERGRRVRADGTLGPAEVKL